MSPRFRFVVHVIARPAAAFLSLLAAGCSTVSPELQRERDAAERLGETYRERFERRTLPPLAADAPYEALLERALHADPEIEAAYFAWAAGVERAVVAGALPQPELGIGWMLTEPPTWMWQNVLLAAEQMFPAGAKLEAAEAMALAEAGVAKERFVAIWLERKGEFRASYAAFDRAAREVELADREVALLEPLARATSQRVATGAASSDDALRLVLEVEQARDLALQARAALRIAAAEVNARLSREPFEALDPPAPLPPQALAETDEQLLAFAVERNPALREAAATIVARERAIDAANVEGRSDFGLEYRREETDNMFMLTFTLPLRRERIRAGIAAAERAVRESEATRRATLVDVRAETAAALVGLREADRRLVLLRDRLLPLARGASASLQGRYGAGAATFDEWIESRRALLELERAVEQARTDREIAVGRLLACCGAELEGGP
jgi:outer membrane protein TolC